MKEEVELWTSLIVPTLFLDIPNSPYGLWKPLIIPTLFLDVLSSPYGLCGRP